MAFQKDKAAAVLIIFSPPPTSASRGPGAVKLARSSACAVSPAILKKAIRSGDRAEIIRAAKMFSSAQRYKILEEIQKSDGGADLVKNFWNRATHRYDIPETDDRRQFSVAHPRPETKHEPPTFKTPLAVGGDGTSKIVRVAVGDIVHWTTSDNTLVHGKVKTVGRLGVRAVDADGDEWQVLTADLHAGVAASAYIEHLGLVAKAERRNRAGWAALFDVSNVAPEDRERILKSRGA